MFALAVCSRRLLLFWRWFDGASAMAGMELARWHWFVQMVVMVLREWSADSMKRWWRCRSAFSAAMAAALVARERRWKGMVVAA